MTKVHLLVIFTLIRVLQKSDRQTERKIYRKTDIDRNTVTDRNGQKHSDRQKEIPSIQTNRSQNFTLSIISILSRIYLKIRQTENNTDRQIYRQRDRQNEIHQSKPTDHKSSPFNHLNSLEGTTKIKITQHATPKKLLPLPPLREVVPMSLVPKREKPRSGSTSLALGDEIGNEIVSKVRPRLTHNSERRKS